MYKIGFIFWCMLLGGCVALLMEGYRDLMLVLGFFVCLYYVVKMKDSFEVKKHQN